MKYPIVTVPDPILRSTCKSVDLSTQKKEISKFIDQMIDAMRSYDGIGLSAPQMGKNLRIIIAEYQPEEPDDQDPPFPLQIMINPVINRRSKETNLYVEGCLSLPTLELEIERPEKITVTYQNLKGQTITLEADSLLARVVQHEVDHLDGILFTDYLEEKSINANMIELSKLKYGFISSSDIAIPLLNALSNSALRPDIIISETAKPSGRGLNIKPNPIADLAQNLNIPLIETDSKTKTESIFKKFKLDVCLIFAFGQIIPQSTIDEVKYGVYNVHPSLLPQLRGATPIQTALLEGLNKTGITLMKINNKMDEGDIIAQTVLNIDSTDHCRELWDKVAKKSAQFIPNALANAITGKVTQVPQHGDPTFTYKIPDNELQILPHSDPKKVYFLIKASNCGKRPFIILNNKRIILENADFDGQNLILKKIQIEGKKISDVKSLNTSLLEGLQKFNKMIKY